MELENPLSPLCVWGSATQSPLELENPAYTLCVCVCGGVPLSNPCKRALLPVHLSLFQSEPRSEEAGVAQV